MARGGHHRRTGRQQLRLVADALSLEYTPDEPRSGDFTLEQLREQLDSMENDWLPTVGSDRPTTAELIEAFRAPGLLIDQPAVRRVMNRREDRLALALRVHGATLDRLRSERGRPTLTLIQGGDDAA